MPKDIHMKLILYVPNCPRNLFYLKNEVKRCTVASMKTEKLTFLNQSDSVVCITPRSQNAHCGVKIEIFESLWLVLKGQWGEILLGVNISFITGKI